MKQFRRVFSFLTVMLLVFSAFADPLGPVLTASADNTPTNGSAEISETPNDISGLGEWYYWVENGTAIIAGYGNKEETSLKIPYNLGGYPVTGIAHNAFSDNTALSEIQIHTNVTQIAADAFEGLDNLTIAAYHGSYALAYAVNTGMKSKNISTAAEFAEGAIDLSGINPKGYSELTSTSVVFGAGEATFLAEGQVVYFPAQGNFQTGLAKRVVSISTTELSSFVVLSDVEFGDAFVSFCGEGDLYLDWDHAIYSGEDIFPIQDEVSSAGLFVADYNGSVSNAKYSKTFGIKIPINQEWSVEGSVTANVTANARYTIHRSGISLSLKDAEVKVSAETDGKLALKYKGKAPEAKSYYLTKKGFQSSKVSIPFISVYGINGYVEFEVVAELDGSFEVSVRNTSVNTYTYKNGHWTHTDSTKNNPYFAGKVEAKVKVGPKLAIGISIGAAETFEAVFFEASIGVYVEGGGSINTTHIQGTASKHLCADITVKAYVEYAIKFGLVKLKTCIGDIKIEGKLYIQFPQEGKNKIPIGDPISIHFDNAYDSILPSLSQLQFSETCDLKGRKISFDDGVSKCILQQYDVNAPIVPPAAPKRTGYRFDGWYIDGGQSGIGNTCYDIIPYVTRMPYAGVYGTVYAYAKWFDMYPVASFKLDKDTITGFSNTSKVYTLKPIDIKPTNANNKSVTWKSSNTNVATVDSNGNVHLKNAGTATITATSVSNPKATASCTVTVRQSVTGISLNEKSVSCYSDNIQNVQLKATVGPSNAYDKSIVWSSSNPSVAEVSSTGYVTLKKVGTAVISCTSVTNPNVVATCPVAVRQAVTGITLNKSSMLLTNADMSPVKMKATVAPADAYNKSLTWESSNPAVATVGGDGTIYPKGLGTTVITARSVSNPNITAKCTVEIIQAVTEIQLNERSVTKYSDFKDPIQLTPVVLPDNAGNKSVTWETSNPNVVTVTANGVVTVKAAGSAVVTCRSVSNPNVIAECKFTILQAVTDITLNKTAINCTTDEINVTYLACTVGPADAYNKAVTWTSTDPKVATVSNDGVVTIKGAGEAEIICRSVSTPYIFASCKVNVELAVRSMKLNETSIFRYSNQEGDIQMIAYIEGVESHDRGIKWVSSNPAVAEIGDDGIVKIKEFGTATITCTSMSNKDVSAQCLITVAQSVTSVSLDKHKITRDSNNLTPYTLTAAVGPENAGNRNVIWESSNENVATVSNDGTITFIGAGSTTITCRSVSDPDVFDTCAIVINQAVNELSLNYKTYSCFTDSEAIQLAAYVQPYYAKNREVTWSTSNSAVATVSENGVVTVVGAGKAVITCTSVGNPAVSATCTITVNRAVTSIALSDTEVALFSNTAEPYQLTADILPSNATNKTLIWTSSDESVASVSDTGLVSACGTGVAMITCTSVTNAEVYAQCVVTVNQEVLNITLNESEITCYNDEGNTIRVTANVQPAYASTKTVKWSSSDKNVATVSSSGLITIKGVGDAVITCASKSNPEVTAAVAVHVKQTMESITLNESEITLFSDDTEGAQLKATILPTDTDDTEVYWISSDTTVAVVSADGLVNAVGQGVAEISCRSARRPDEVFASCAVTVKQKVSAVEIEGDFASMMPGETISLTATCYPATANDVSVTWSSRDSTVATVNQNGIVTGVTYGSTVITATANDGSGVVGTYNVTVEHELGIDAAILESTVFTQGNADVTLATFNISSSAARRLGAAGQNLKWTLKKPDSSDDVVLDVYETVLDNQGQSYETTSAVLHGSTFSVDGSKTYTVTCTAGEYSTSVRVKIAVDGSDYAQKTALKPSTITTKIGETVLMPTAPESLDGKPVPTGVKLIGVTGDARFADHSVVEEKAGQMQIVFDESGVYNAVAEYRCGNIAYDINLTFYVQDENGVVRVKTDSVTLNTAFADMVQGGKLTLKATVAPADAYDPALIWTSTDTSVVKVSSNGVVTAVGPGSAAVVCTAKDGSGASDVCCITVESFLQLDEDEATYNVYTGGDDHADLGIVNISYNSEVRLVNSDLNVTWTLEKLSGDACEIAIEEFRSEAENGVTVSGNRIKLLRINGAGNDSYRLICRAGEYEESCVIHINVVDAAVPDVVTLKKASYTGAIGTPIAVSTAYTGGTLPVDTVVSLRGGRAFENALSEEYDSTDPWNLIFAKAGTYNANVIFEGSNYSFTCPIKLVVRDENGNVPANITDMSVNPQSVYLAVGESTTVSAVIEPAGAAYSRLTWSSVDTAVATVSSKGVITAIGEGTTYVKFTVPESDEEGGCYVVVEDGMTLENSRVERTVFVDGITRVRLDTVKLTAASSVRLETEPVWTLARVSGNNLTLKADAYNTVDVDGNTIYGCAINLYSLSREGDCTYELICTVDGESVSIPVVIHAAARDRNLPAAISLRTNVFTANVDELITMIPDVVCMPEGSSLPDGIRVAMEGDKVFQNSLNWEDYCVSQSRNTVSFSRAGLYEANLIYSYSNIRYVVPVTFRIKDSSGNVPILPSSASLNSRSLWLVKGESADLSVAFTPADADNQKVTWTSSNPSIAQVDANGHVTAVSKGQTTIVCVPDDPYLSRMICSVWVEDYLTIETAEDSISLYKQGEQRNEVFSVLLSQGTIQRLAKAGITPEWSMNRISGAHTEVSPVISVGADAIIVHSVAMNSAGRDVYRVTCKAGKYTKSADFVINVVDMKNAAEYITPAKATVKANVGETVTLDFTPVCHPSGSSMPKSSAMRDLYAGIGDAYYEAIDYSAYEENGNMVTVRFTKPGRYLLSRQFFLDNIHYSEVCEIVVGTSTEPLKLIAADTTDAVLYLGGTTGAIANVSITDTLMQDVFAGKIEWTLSHKSGNSMSAVLKQTDAGVVLYATDAAAVGTNVWQITCSYGSFTESVDVTVDVRQPRNAVPENVALAVDSVSGMMGDWLSIPIAAICSPADSALPETGDAFWSFEPSGVAADVCRWTIEDGMLKTLFLQPGYFAGTLHYAAGNFHYDMPVYFAVTDEEGVLNVPSFAMNLIGTAGTVYTTGATGVSIGTAAVSRNSSNYYMGEAESYFADQTGVWKIRVSSGTAAALSVKKNSNNTASIILDSVNGTGSVTYVVSCTVGETVYKKTGTLIVAEAEAALPNPTLGHRTFYAKPGELIRIGTTVYDLGSGSILQSSTSWNPGGLLPVIGNEYAENDSELQMTFYEEGTYESTITAQIGNLTYEIPFTAVISGSTAAKVKQLKLPAALVEIDEYAFENSAAEIIDLRETKIETIGKGAFKNCVDLKTIYIPESVTEIAEDAFYGCLNVTIVCIYGSAADDYALANGIPVCYE